MTDELIALTEGESVSREMVRRRLKDNAYTSKLPTLTDTFIQSKYKLNYQIKNSNIGLNGDRNLSF